MDFDEINAALKDFGLTCSDLEDAGDFEFKPLKGAYHAHIAELARIKGESDKGEYDFYSLSFQIDETVEGDPGENRYVKKTFSLIDHPEYGTGHEHVGQLINVLANCNVDIQDGLKMIDKTGKPFEDSVALVEALTPFVTDKPAKLRLYHSKGKQRVKVVTELKVKESESTETVPF